MRRMVEKSSTTRNFRSLLTAALHFACLQPSTRASRPHRLYRTSRLLPACTHRQLVRPPSTAVAPVQTAPSVARAPGRATGRRAIRSPSTPHRSPSGSARRCSTATSPAVRAPAGRRSPARARPESLVRRFAERVGGSGSGRRRRIVQAREPAARRVLHDRVVLLERRLPCPRRSPRRARRARSRRSISCTAAATARALRCTERGAQSSLRSASIIAPRIRMPAYVSKLAPRLAA